MRAGTTALLMAAAAMATTAEAASVKPETATSAIVDWAEWRAAENAHWSTNEFAILKIDDAVYLDPGQSAWLSNKKQKVLQYAWTLDAPAPSGLSVTFNTSSLERRGAEKLVTDRPVAVVTKDGKTEEFTLEKPQTVNVAPGIDVRFAPVQVKPGVEGLRVMVYNQGNPAARDFKGLDHFAFNPNAIVGATFEQAQSPTGVDFQTSRGWFKRFYRMGVAVFTLEGKSVRLPMYADVNDPVKISSLSAFFVDSLSGKETYGVGRYLDVEVKGGLPKTLTLDFNRTYNPNCARSPHYNCPYAIDKIPVALRAGEKMPPKP